MEPEKKGKITYIRKKEDIKETKNKNNQFNEDKFKELNNDIKQSPESLKENIILNQTNKLKEEIKHNKINNILNEIKIKRKYKRPYFMFGFSLGYLSCYYYYKYKIEKIVNKSNYILEDEIKQLNLELNDKKNIK
jgi:hypothetical protein